ncbi:error-prone DNA polymerase [Pararhodospirillum oryzae]|uniref:Error-prone DNA polymerase n=1 Tax=Pararhodospirillum oryzae TaxID=478448 RepID=A0A512H988_9PROT|nr:error-prone DNA polymerase [Pararhodospirillum oryzae]GEO82023.1 error-prone DNA polymerase [Pararhodospirillum oryzae]
MTGGWRRPGDGDPAAAPSAPCSPEPPPRAELFAQSCFSFLEAASTPEDLVITAAALGLHALAVTDRNSLAGVVRAHRAARAHGVRLVVGALIDPRPAEGPMVLMHPGDRAAYGRLARLITRGRRAAPKGECSLGAADLHAHAEGQWVTVIAPEGLEDPGADPVFRGALAAWKQTAGARLSLALTPRHDGCDRRRLWRLARLAERLDIPPLAAGAARLHAPASKPLLDVLTCLRHHVRLDEAGWRLAAHAEAHLRGPADWARLMADHPEALARPMDVVAGCSFSLAELRHDYPAESGDEPPDRRLERLTRAGARERYPEGVPESVEQRLRHELTLIARLGYAPYFLTVEALVAFARGRGILCQGRGSAANSAVCYCLGITAVDPARSDLLFERFISAARNEPPDIDVDFEHERREEVIQYLYETYGRDHAGLTATVITWRARSALRDVGRVLGLSDDTVSALCGCVWGSSSRLPSDARVREAGLDPDSPRLRQALDLAAQLMGLPRHLSQHVGGFVLTRSRLDEVVPIENAAMPGRTVIQWDKDDLDTLGLLKIDVLALGMLSCLRRALALVARHHGRPLTLATIPPEDPLVYDMLCQGDSLGVFQVESRAQMAMLPRLRPRTFYDLVIEVAIVRPGPIQGDMVHPYLRRRRGEEPVRYPSPLLRRVLEKTLGVPLFQEQAMRIAIEGAGFSAEDADRLRRAMATFRHAGEVGRFRDAFVAGMVRNGLDPAFAERCFRQIEGFGSYGFPESHAASFALLVYASAWLKCHAPAAFACALLNSQPLGFYAPAQIVRDARAHGVEVRPVDINQSEWDCTLEAVILPGGRRALALRLGLRQIKGLGEAAGRAVVAARGAGYDSPEAVGRRAGIARAALERLVGADAFAGLGRERREALWAVKGLDPAPLPLFAAAETRRVETRGTETRRVETGGTETRRVETGGAGSRGSEGRQGEAGEGDNGDEEAVAFAPLSEGEALLADLAALRLSLRAHPLALLRPTLTRAGFHPCRRLAERADGTRASVAGLVLCRQRPGTASGVVFITLEDEDAGANVIVWASVFEAHRRIVMGARLLAASGRIQREGTVIHLVADHLADLTGLLATLAPPGEARVRAVATSMEPARADRLRHNRPGPGTGEGR